jgi:LacI family transcriptional regulator
MSDHKEITIYDVASELNISASTVSRALKNNPIINKETRLKVIQCAERMGYRSNAFASNLRRKCTNTIGVIVPRLDSNFMSACLAGMEEVVQAKGYNMIISQSHESVARESQNVLTMYNNRVDGLIISLTVEDSNIDYLNRFDEKHIPVVFFDRVPDKTENTCFIVDNVAAAENATNHLIQQGCKNLVHLTINSKSNVYADRKKGFNLALSEFEGKCKGQVVFLNALNLESGKEAISQLMKMDVMPDGLFVSNDLAAVGCIMALQENGFKVPEDVAVVGFNNDQVSTIVTPQLTTISYPGKEAGILAAKSLIEHLEGENTFAYTNKVVLNTKLIERGSSLRKAKNQ